MNKNGQVPNSTGKYRLYNSINININITKHKLNTK